MLGRRQVPRFASALSRSLSQASHDTCSDPEFQRARPTRSIADDWAELKAEWQAFIATLDHGYDFERMAIDFQPGKPLDAASANGRRSPPIAAGNRPACGSKRASRTTSRQPAAIKLPRTNRRHSQAVAVRAGRRDDRLPRRPTRSACCSARSIRRDTACRDDELDVRESGRDRPRHHDQADRERHALPARQRFGRPGSTTIAARSRSRSRAAR